MLASQSDEISDSSSGPNKHPSRKTHVAEVIAFSSKPTSTRCLIAEP